MRRAVAAILTIPLCGSALLGCTPVTSAPSPSATSSTTQAPTGQSSPTPAPTSQPSGTPTEPTRPTPSGNGLHQDWHFATDAGARGTFTVPSETNKLAQRIEKERSNAKGKRLYYVLIDVDNTSGSKRVRLDTIEFVDQDGHRIKSLDEQDVIERWHLPSGYAARRRLIKLQTDMAVSLAPGKEGTVVKVFNRRIPSISRAFIYLEHGLAVVEASVG
jgi:hypothetical protein